MPPRLVPVLIAAVVVAAVAAILLAPVLEHSRLQSPDGAFVAVVRTQPAHILLPALPGQGSDKPGRITVYGGDRSCGGVWVPMVSMARDLRWELDGIPRRAAIRLVATWDLDQCALESVSGGSAGHS
jgi:hypothetical protein